MATMPFEVIQGSPILAPIESPHTTFY